MTRPTVTVLTPTYNRASTIHRVWESLQQQTFRDFEWMVVDDGSADDTVATVEAWRDEAEFTIVLRQLDRHRGKPAADNEGIRCARGTFICPMDSDDRFDPAALEVFLDAWNSIPEDDRASFCGITARTRGACRERPHGPLFPSDPFDVSFMDLYYVHGRHEEQAKFLRRDLLLSHPFPEVDEFVPESVVWHALGLHYKTRCINAVLRTFYLGSPHALTGTGGMRFSLGRSYALARFVNDHHAYFGRLPHSAAWHLLTYGRYTRHAGTPFNQSLDALHPRTARTLFRLLYPVSLAVAKRDRLLGKVVS